MELALSILGLLLTVVGLIALWPSLTVSANEPMDPAQPFSVPFQITNASYLPLKDVRVYAYIHQAGNTPTSSESGAQVRGECQRSRPQSIATPKRWKARSRSGVSGNRPATFNVSRRSPSGRYEGP